jgi:hypothetical protein
VVIATATGERLSSGRMEPRWEPPGTLPRCRVGGQFDKLAAPILGEARARELRKCIWRFEETERAVELVGSAEGRRLMAMRMPDFKVKVAEPASGGWMLCGAT